LGGGPDPFLEGSNTRHLWLSLTVLPSISSHHGFDVLGPVYGRPLTPPPLVPLIRCRGRPERERAAFDLCPFVCPHPSHADEEEEQGGGHEGVLDEEDEDEDFMEASDDEGGRWGGWWWW
jgi:hypothetical protein